MNLAIDPGVKIKLEMQSKVKVSCMPGAETTKIREVSTTREVTGGIIEEGR